MAQIIVPEDLHKYSIALRNSGVTPENLGMLESSFLVFLFEYEGAEKIANAVADGGTDYDNIKELIEGNPRYLFAGLRALLSVMACLQLLSQNRIQVARQNINKFPVNSHVTQRREEADVVQALSYQAKNLIHAMDKYLQKESKNPLGLRINNVVLPTRYATNTSGTIPAAQMFMGFLRF